MEQNNALKITDFAIAKAGDYIEVQLGNDDDNKWCPKATALVIHRVSSLMSIKNETLIVYKKGDKMFVGFGVTMLEGQTGMGYCTHAEPADASILIGLFGSADGGIFQETINLLMSDFKPLPPVKWVYN
jgi:hypothetical protein